MHRIFLPIYHFFQQHRTLMYLLMGVTFLVFLFFGLRVKYDENIASLLPSSDVESQFAFSSIELKDKIYIQITSAGDPCEPEVLAERMDQFTDLLLERDSTSHFISNILVRMEPEVGLNALDYVLEHLPSFVDTSAYTAFAQALEPSTVQAQMERNYELMMADETGDITQMIAYDPLDLKTAIVGDLLEGGLSGYNIIDGHFFCPDSTVAIAWLAPAFKSLDSKSARAFARKLSRSQREFGRLHPEVKVYAHGEPIGSVSNAGRIRSDLLVTVGISLLLILLLLGFFFRSIGFIARLLLPIAYGSTFSLAFIYWIKGGMSLMALGMGAIVLGVAISYCLHIMVHHFFAGNAEKMLRDESTPVFLGCLTTVGAFSSLFFTDSDLLRDFGLFASLALIGSTLFGLIFLPHFLPKIMADRSGKTFRRISRLNNLPFDRKPWFLTLVAIIMVVGIIFSPNVQFDSDLRNLDYNSDQEVAAESLFDSKNNDGYKHLYFATVSKQVDEALAANQTLMPILDSLSDTGWVHSYNDIVSHLFVPETQQQQRIAAWQAFWTPLIF